MSLNKGSLGWRLPVLRSLAEMGRRMDRLRQMLRLFHKHFIPFLCYEPIVLYEVNPKEFRFKPYLVSIQKREFLVKVKEREDCNHRDALEYFDDFNLKRDAEIGQKGRLWMGTSKGGYHVAFHRFRRRIDHAVYGKDGI
jgi:hypothetical protein